jgi:hypothetical protein
MKFYKKAKTVNNPDDNIYSVFMNHEGRKYFVCEMVSSDSAEDATVNELGLTLRTRLTRSKGKYAMLEGSIFSPERLLEAACGIDDYTREDIDGRDDSKGYTLLTITADGCVNKYMVFNVILLDTLIDKMDSRLRDR